MLYEYGGIVKQASKFVVVPDLAFNLSYGEWIYEHCRRR